MSVNANEKKLYESGGYLKYDTANGFYRLTVEIDQQLADYYRSLIPKYIRINRPRWAAHITVVRPEKEVPKIMEPWGRYAGKRINFLYEPYVYEGRAYFWLNVYSKELEKIRGELGLEVVSRYTLPPEGFVKCFHCTIANEKVEQKC